MDLKLARKPRLLCTRQQIKNLFEERNHFMNVFGNSSLLLNPLQVQCGLCGSIISLGHMNNIVIQNDKLIKHIRRVYLTPANSSLKGKLLRCFYKVISGSVAYFFR